MASNSDMNSLDITAAAGWEITPYVSLSGTEHFDSPVQEGTMSCGGLERGVVLAPVPENVVIPQQPQPLVVQEQKTRRRRCLIKAKVVSVSYVSFNYFKSCEDPVRYDFGMYEVGCVPEETPGMSTYGHILPFPGLLINWKRETRERLNGTQDKFYFHPTCKKMFRSVVEVINFIRSSNNITSNEEGTNSEELQGPQQVKLSEASSVVPNDKKRENNGSQNKSSKSKKRRIFPVSSRALKTRDQLGLEEFFADAYRNLMNLSPSNPDGATIEEEKKISVEAFLLDAQENLLKGFQKEETRIHPTPTAGSYQNGRPEEIDGIMNNELSRENDISQHVQNLEPTIPQKGGNEEPLIPLQGGNANAHNAEASMNRLTDKEMEVVKIFSEGLGRGNINDQQGVEENLLDYSHFLFEPIPPGLF